MKVLTLLLLALCLPTIVGAQDSTEEPFSREAITNWTNEPLFPVAVRFTLSTIFAPEDIRDLTLTVEQPGRFSETMALDPSDAAAASDPFSQLAYVWTVPDDEPPLAFRDVEFAWRFVGGDGEVYGVRDRFFFADSRTAWAVSQPNGDPLRLIAPAEGVNLSRVRRDVSPVLDLLRRDFSPRYAILLYADSALLACPVDAEGAILPLLARDGSEFECDPALLARIYADSAVTLLRLNDDTSAEALDMLISFFIDEAFADSWDAAEVPAWFRSGFKQFFTPSFKADRLPPVLEAARQRNLLSLDQLAAAPLVDDPLWRGQSYSLVLYLASQLGVDGLFNFGRALGNAESFEAAYAQVVGQPLSALPRTWERWLFTREAELAYAYIPYGAETPTPTLTPTETLTPSRTPVPTDTLTPTRTPTPIPTRTPTLIPTVTPRPPGSLIVATPVLSPTPSPTALPAASAFSVGSDAQVIIIGVLLVLLTGLVVLYFRLGRTS
jgi:hypothetical protein